mmetsp:Transcript_15241/g.33367  ORF Transcript_15241/g.33367 Transcript_15241/m.33367 type:complete len:248 (-) Transcript_15241:947-1690(-)
MAMGVSQVPKDNRGWLGVFPTQRTTHSLDSLADMTKHVGTGETPTSLIELHIRKYNQARHVLTSELVLFANLQHEIICCSKVRVEPPRSSLQLTNLIHNSIAFQQAKPFWLAAKGHDHIAKGFVGNLRDADTKSDCHFHGSPSHGTADIAEGDHLGRIKVQTFFGSFGLDILHDSCPQVLPLRIKGQRHSRTNVWIFHDCGNNLVGKNLAALEPLFHNGVKENVTQPHSLGILRPKRAVLGFVQKCT